jgi:predicted dehydrogenase
MSQNLVYIIGAGPMAVDYAKALKSLGTVFKVVGRSQTSCDKFKTETGVECISGGFENWLSGLTEMPEKVIVAVSEENLGSVTEALILKSIANILVEKPGAATYEEITKLVNAQAKSKSEVYVGYNRRFYESVQMAKKLIQEDGGVQSFFFEFTEWGHVIRNKVCPQLVKEEWLWHNSTHVIDLAFYLGGFPEKISSFKAGTLDWHSRASKYSGAGVTKNGAVFSYMANWAAPGRWVVEILTNQRRFIFKPLEKLQIQKLGSVAVEEFALDNKQDIDFKPGLYNQIKAFLNNDKSTLVTLSQQAENLKWFREIEMGN